MISNAKSFTVFVAISNIERQSSRRIGEKREGGEYVISASGEDTEEWREAKSNSEEKKGELSKKIELSPAFEELSKILSNFEEGKIRKANKESIRKESIGNQLPEIQEESETIYERRFRGFRKRWGSEFTSRTAGSRHWGEIVGGMLSREAA